MILFNADYDHEGVVPGSVRHFPYPVNSVFNDYFMCPLDLRTAYFVSDREMESRDDIYYLQTEEDLGTQQGDPHFGMSEESAILGGGFITERGHGIGYQGDYFTKTICAGRFANDSLF